MRLSSSLPIFPLRAPPPLLLGPVHPAPVLSFTSIAAFALRSSPAGAAFSPPLLAFTFALGIANIGLLPGTHPYYDFCASKLLPLSVALGLLSAGGTAASDDFEQQVEAPLRPMLVAFCVGAVGTLIGSLCAFGLSVRLSLLTRAGAASAAGLMCATCKWNSCYPAPFCQCSKAF
jgi:hypothetical protein